jgi:hypothetical protein
LQRRTIGAEMLNKHCSALGALMIPGGPSRLNRWPTQTSQACFCRSATFAKAIVSAAPPRVFTSVAC